MVLNFARSRPCKVALLNTEYVIKCNGWLTANLACVWTFSVLVLKFCFLLLQLKVPMADKPGSTVNFRKLLLNRCQKEFEKDKADDDVFEKKQKELEAATTVSGIFPHRHSRALRKGSLLKAAANVGEISEYFHSVAVAECNKYLP